jgi:hypothetical protein
MSVPRGRAVPAVAVPRCRPHPPTRPPNASAPCPMPNATHRRARSSSCPCSSTYLLAARAPPPAPPWLRRPSHPNAMQRLQLPSAATACAARRVLSHSFSPHSEAPSFFSEKPYTTGCRSLNCHAGATACRMLLPWMLLGTRI